MFNPLSLITSVVNIGKGMVDGWQKRKASKLDADLRVQEAKTQGLEARLITGQAGDIAWENTSIANSGWKDEFWTIVLSIPLIMCFIPGCVDTVMDGFFALEQTPTWYQWAISIAIGSAFGVKQFTKFMALKKGD